MYWPSYIPIELPSKDGMTEEEFFNFCSANKHIKIEKDENGQIQIMPPSGLESERKTGLVFGALFVWNQINNNGIVFGSSAGFSLPDGSVRSPDCAWIPKEQYLAVDKNEREKFARIVPHFVVEVLSPSDDLGLMKDKMHMWIQNGILLGWLIDPYTNQVFIYRKDSTVSKIDSFNTTISGEDVLPGFEFNLQTLL